MTPSPPMDALTLFQFLGYSPAHPPFNQWLDQQRVFDRPHTAQEDEAWDEDEYDAEENARASEIEEVERHSACLIYDERRQYERLWGDAKSNGDFIFRQFALYAPGVRGYSGFKGSLPMNLRFNMSQREVRSHIGPPPIATRQVHDMLADLFVYAHIHVNVSYHDHGKSIAMIHVRLPHSFDLRMLGLQTHEPDARALAHERVVACLGHSASNAELDTLLSPLGWNVGDEDMADCDEVTDLMPRTGVTLYYRDTANYKKLTGKAFAEAGPIFAGIRFNRRGDMYSEGFDGALPFGMTFHDTPEQAVQRLGRAPEWQSVEEDTGAYKWQLPDYNLHILFSLLDNQVYRVSCFAKFLDTEHFPESVTSQ